MIGAAAARAFQNMRDREADVLRAYTPGARPVRPDVAKASASDVAIDPLSVVAPEGSYFVVSGANGRFAFTRDGAFAVREGALVDASGRSVYGYRAAGSTLAPVRLEDVDVALGLAGDLRIENDGSLTLSRASIDPRSGLRETRRETVGRIGLARFAPGTALTQIDASHFSAPPNVAPHFGCPGDGNFAAVGPNRRERSEIDIDAGLQRLQEAYLAIDALRAADNAGRGLEKTAMDLLK